MCYGLCLIQVKYFVALMLDYFISYYIHIISTMQNRINQLLGKMNVQTGLEFTSPEHAGPTVIC